MSRQILGSTAKQEIFDTIKRCRNSNEIAAEAARLAEHFGVGVQRIYELTKHIRPSRRPRADKGRRVADIETNAALRKTIGRVLEFGIPTAESINQALLNGEDPGVTFTTVNRYMRELGLDKKSRREPNTPHRRFEASAPGEMFQFDMSGLKTRWFDHKTRRIINISNLDVSKNHPNTDPNRVPVWRFVLVDDFSRRVFLRYVAVPKPNSTHVTDFLLQAYAELGVPRRLYTDNDAVIKYKRTARTTEILNKVLSDQGGYENIFHLPGNARATGKVERLNQTIENCEKFIGVYIAQRGSLDIETLNARLAVGIMHRINTTVHSETGQAPLERWESRFSVIRRLDYAALRAAFMADEYEVKLKGDCSFRCLGSRWQLPTGDLLSDFEPNPFPNWIGQKIRVVFHDDQDFFTVIGADGVEYDVLKSAAAPDTAGEFRSTKTTKAEQLRKELRAEVREENRRIKDANEPAPIRFFDDTDELSAELPENVSRFPKTERLVDVAAVAELAPGRIETHDPAVKYWEAFARFESRFATKTECKTFLDTAYPSRDGDAWLLLSELEQRFADRGEAPRLRTVG